MIIDCLYEKKDRLKITDPYLKGESFRIELFSDEPLVYLNKENALILADYIYNKVNNK